MWSVRVLRGRDDGSPRCFLDAGLKILAQIGPSTSGVVNLLVLVGEAGVVREAGCREREDDCVLDVVIGGAVVFDFVVWVL